MRRLAALAVLLLAACKSSDGFAHQTLEAGNGAPIEIELVGAIGPTLFVGGRDTPQQAQFQIRVSNNSDATQVVKRVMVYQHGSAPIMVDTGYGGFDKAIDPGHDETFTIVCNVTQVSNAREGDVRSVVIRAEVLLQNGDSYVETFDVPVGVQIQ
jgi:hypothetical protein